MSRGNVAEGPQSREKGSHIGLTSPAFGRGTPLRFIEDVPRVAVVSDELNPFTAEAHKQAVDGGPVWLLAREDCRAPVHQAGLESHAGKPRVVREVAADVRRAALLGHSDELETDILS